MFWERAMMRAVLLVGLLLLLLPAIGRAGVLGTATITHGNSIDGPDHRIRPAFGYDPGNWAIQRLLFEDTWLDSTSVGTVLEATAETDTDFASVAGRLADGIDDIILLCNCEAIACRCLGATESRFFALSTPDFGPAAVERVRLSVDALSFGRDSRGGQMVEYSFTITVEGRKGVPTLPTSWGRVKATYR